MPFIDAKQIEQWKATIEAGDVIHGPGANGAILALLAEREKILELLEDIQWDGDSRAPLCPECCGLKPGAPPPEAPPRSWRSGHYPECRIAPILAKAGR